MTPLILSRKPIGKCRHDLCEIFRVPPTPPLELPIDQKPVIQILNDALTLGIDDERTIEMHLLCLSGNLPVTCKDALRLLEDEASEFHEWENWVPAELAALVEFLGIFPQHSFMNPIIAMGCGVEIEGVIHYPQVYRNALSFRSENHVYERGLARIPSFLYQRNFNHEE